MVLRPGLGRQSVMRSFGSGAYVFPLGDVFRRPFYATIHHAGVLGPYLKSHRDNGVPKKRKEQLNSQCASIGVISVFVRMKA